MIYLSLCIPTYGVSDWVFPVLNSIYSQTADIEEYEVIVTDNGGDEIFCKQMQEYVKDHSNLVYKKTDAYLFQNQIEALRLSRGAFLKFVNHRAVMTDGSLAWMINLVKEMIETKPVIYLSNGELNYKERKIYRSFDQFVCGLKHYASWTTGVGVWRSDFEKIPENHHYNKISPHSDVLFAERSKEQYIIDDKVWSYEIDRSHKNKGNYDLYKAFAIEEISITLGLFLDGDITAKTFKTVKKSYRDSVVTFYRIFNILKRPCSYRIDGLCDATGIFLSRIDIVIRAWAGLPLFIIKVLKDKLRKGIGLLQ